MSLTADPQVPASVLAGVHQALADGGGVAVVPLSALLPDPEEDGLLLTGVLDDEARAVQARAVAAVSLCSARYLPPLPLDLDNWVLLYRVPAPRPSRVVELLDALRLWPHDPDMQPDRDVLELTAGAIRALLPSSGPSRPVRRPVRGGTPKPAAASSG